MKPGTQDDEGELSTTVKFNVGGKIYQVSRSLLEGFPDTMLAQQAALMPSSSPPVFIDRDPDRFAFCLDYMRDNGTVHLPETVPKLAFLEELKFFGFEEIDEIKINDKKSTQNCVARFHHLTVAIRQRIANLENEVDALERTRNRRMTEIEIEKVVLKCIVACVESTRDLFGVKYNDVDVCFVHEDEYFIDCCDKLALVVSPDDSTPSKVYLRRKFNAAGQN